MKVLKLQLIIGILTVLFLSSCNNSSPDKKSDDTATNIIETTTPANDIPTPANDSLTRRNRDSTKK